MTFVGFVRRVAASVVVARKRTESNEICEAKRLCRKTSSISREIHLLSLKVEQQCNFTLESENETT